MKPRNLLTLFTCFLCAQAINAGAQNNYDLKFTEATKDKVRPESFLGTDDSGNVYMYSLRMKPKVILPFMVFNFYDIDIQKYIKKYDRNLNLIDNKQILANNEGMRQSQVNGRLNISSLLYFMSMDVKNMDLPSFMLGGKCYMVIANDKKPRNDYYVAEIDLQTGLVGKMTHLLSLGKKREEHHLKALKFEHSFSPDSSHILFVASYKQGFGKKGAIGYSAAVLTSDMQPVWNSQYTLPKISKTFSYKEASVGNDGEVMILGRNYNKKEKNNPGYSSVFYLDKTHPRPKEHRLNFNGDFVGDVHMSLNKTGDPIVIGYYKSQRKQSGYDGLFYASMDTAKKLYDVRKKEFDASFIGSNYTEKAARKLHKKEKKGKDVKEASGFTFTEVVPTPDGGYVGIAEEYYLVKRTVTSTSRGITTSHREYIHYYNDLMVFRFNKEGEILSMNKISKSNAYNLGSNEVKPYTKDYTSVTSGSEVYLLFNDDGGKTDNVKRRDRNAVRNRSTYIAHIGSDGSMNKDVLVEEKEMGKYTFDMHKNICKISDDRVIFIATKGPMGRTRKTKIGSFSIRKA